MRLIDADELIKSFVTKGQDMGKKYGIKYGEPWILDYDDIKDVIDNAPTVVRTERPCVILNDMAIYITQGHIDAMIEYEKREQVKEIVDSMMQSFDNMTVNGTP